MNDRISVSSKMYVRMEIKTKGISPVGDVVDLGLSTSDETPPSTWVTGHWVTEAARFWAYLLVGPGSTYGAVPPGRYWLWAKVTDNPELVYLPSENQLKFA